MVQIAEVKIPEVGLLDVALGGISWVSGSEGSKHEGGHWLWDDGGHILWDDGSYIEMGGGYEAV